MSDAQPTLKQKVSNIEMSLTYIRTKIATISNKINELIEIINSGSRLVYLIGKLED